MSTQPLLSKRKTWGGRPMSDVNARDNVAIGRRSKWREAVDGIVHCLQREQSEQCSTTVTCGVVASGRSKHFEWHRGRRCEGRRGGHDMICACEADWKCAVWESGR